MLAKKALCVLLSLAMVVSLPGCGGKRTQDDGSSSGSVESTMGAQILGDEAGSTSGAADDLKSEVDEAEEVEQFASLDDPELLQYLQDDIYAGLECALDTDEYEIENVTALYVAEGEDAPKISKEYQEEVAYNSRENIYFGYTLSELDEQFEGTRYVFTLGENGETAVREFEAYDDSYDKAIANVAVGTGAILVCVTVSAVAGATVGTAAPVCAVFAVAADTGAKAALSGGLISGAVAGLAKAYETGGVVDEALKAAAVEGSEGFKWGAILGTLSGAVKEASALRKAANAAESVDDATAASKTVAYYRQSELDALAKYGGKEQVTYLAGEEVPYGTLGGSRPDIVRTVNGKLEAIEVKNYNLESAASRSELYSELKREIAERVANLPEGSTQRIVLDIRDRGFEDALVESVKEEIWEKLADVYPNIPIDLL